MEEFEELKRKLMNKVQNKEMPEEVTQIINDVYEKIMQIIQMNGVSNATVKKVISDSNKLLNQKVNNNIANERKNSQLEQLNYILIGIKTDLEKTEKTQLNDEQEEEENNRVNQRHISSFEGMDMNSTKDVSKIVDSLDESVREVRSAIRQVIRSRGVPEDKIEEVYHEFSRVIHNVQSKVPEELMRVLKEQDESTICEIIETYEEYEAFKAQKRNKTKHEQFADKYDAGISLEEQNENAKRFIENVITSEPDEKSLPNDILK